MSTTKKRSLLERGLIGLTFAGLTFGAVSKDALALRSQERDNKKGADVKVVLDSLVINFEELKAQYDRKNKDFDYDQDFILSELIKIHDQFIRFSSVRGTKFLKFFIRSFGEWRQSCRTGNGGLVSMDLPSLKTIFPNAKAIITGSGFKVMELEITQNYTDYGDYKRKPIVIPKVFHYGIVLEIGNEEFVSFVWIVVPEEYMHLYPKGER